MAIDFGSQPPVTEPGSDRCHKCGKHKSLTELWYGNALLCNGCEIERLKAEHDRDREIRMVALNEKDAEIERLREENDHFNAENEKAWNEIARLTASLEEVERLIPAYSPAASAIRRALGHDPQSRQGLSTA